MAVDYQSALDDLRSNTLSTWASKTEASLTENNAAARIHKDFAAIQAPDQFKFGRDSKFFCIGSCFAREIEDAIEHVGLLPVTKVRFLEAFEANADLFEKAANVMGRPTAFLNRYNLGSMADLLDDIAGDRKLDTGLLYDAGNSKFHDYMFSRFLKPLSLDDCIKRRDVVAQTYRAAAEEADVFVYTFGLCEAFFDLDADRYLNVATDPRTAKGRNIEFRFLSPEENLRMGQRIISSVRKINPKARIIVTVSPVPLDVTFTTLDIVVANSLAKSTLLLTAHKLAQEFSDVHYFPSYEMVMNSEQSKAWLWDKKHVSGSMVAHIMQRFIENHIST